MILYTIVDPMEVMMQPQNDDVQYRRVSGCLCACRMQGSECKVDRLISTDLKDYLNPRLEPGTTLNTKQKTF